MKKTKAPRKLTEVEIFFIEGNYFRLTADELSKKLKAPKIRIEKVIADCQAKEGAVLCQTPTEPPKPTSRFTIMTKEKSIEGEGIRATRKNPDYICPAKK